MIGIPDFQGNFFLQKGGLLQPHHEWKKVRALCHGEGFCPYQACPCRGCFHRGGQSFRLGSRVWIIGPVHWLKNNRAPQIGHTHLTEGLWPALHLKAGEDLEDRCFPSWFRPFFPFSVLPYVRE